MYVLGISAYYHDAAAALLKDGKVVAAAQEERFSRKKHDSGFPLHAISYCLEEAAISGTDLDAIVFYEKPFIKFERLLETYLAFTPKGVMSFLASMPVWLKDKLFLKTNLRRELSELFKVDTKKLPKLFFAEHHQSHAASAFFASPYQKAAVLCMDGVGEWTTTSAWLGDGNKLQLQWEIDFPHSLGMLYSAFTYYTGFKVNSGEYKLMGLAPYGKPIYVDLILENLIDVKADGSFRLNMKYFDFATNLTMTNRHFSKLFGGPPRPREAELTQREMDIAASIQKVTEMIVLRLARHLHTQTGADALCLAGGVALNCVANGVLLREGPFKEIWVQPAAGDSGGSLGAALATYYQHFNNQRHVEEKADGMAGGYLGPRFANDEIEKDLKTLGATYTKVEDGDLFAQVAKSLGEEAVVGWFQGRMEFGPRALGGRSILGDPRSAKMQSIMNLKIKYRESFRPFAPAVLAEDVSDYFEINAASPYMLMVAPIRKELRITHEGDDKLFGIARLNLPRSSLPAVTHVDYSARLQTVHEETNPRFYNLLKSFKAQTGCPVLVNTSFNVRGEPIVCSVEDAFRCFINTEMDYLVVENFVLSKREQKVIKTDNKTWLSNFELD